MKKKFCRDLLSLTFLVMLFLHSPAQQKALKVGDKIPENIWTTTLEMVNGSTKTNTLSRDRDKLILLDFWATWCAGCLQNFPKMEALQKQFGDQIKIIPVTKENRATLDKFFASKNGQRYKYISSVAEDKILSTAFPYRVIPFIVWIKDGKVINQTDAEQVTPETIGEILADQSTSLQTVLQISRKRPLMLAEQFDLEKQTSLINYAFFSKGRIRAIQPGSGFHIANNITYGRQFTNTSLMNMFQAIASEIYRNNGERFSLKRIDNRVSDPTQIDFTYEEETGDALIYNLELVVPVNHADGLYPNMLKTLNDYSDYHASIEPQTKKCLILKRISSIDKMATKGEAPIDEFLKQTAIIRNNTLESIIVALNANSRFTSLLVLDETGYQGKVDLNLGKISDVVTLKKALKKYDLDLIEGDREVQMLVINDRPKKNQ